MAVIQVAVEFVLKLEDATMSGVITNNPLDKGGRTRFGIAEVFHPELVRSGYYSVMDPGTAMLEASKLITDEYSTPLWLGTIPDQKLANVVLAFAVNCGVRTAILALQRACNACLKPGELMLTEDGVMGQQTLADVRDSTPCSLLAQFRLQTVKHYLTVAQDWDLRGLMNRAMA